MSINYLCEKFILRYNEFRTSPEISFVGDSCATKFGLEYSIEYWVEMCNKDIIIFE